MDAWTDDTDLDPVDPQRGRCRNRRVGLRRGRHLLVKRHRYGSDHDCLADAAQPSSPALSPPPSNPVTTAPAPCTSKPTATTVS
jgi:hypothetical protein